MNGLTFSIQERHVFLADVLIRSPEQNRSFLGHMFDLGNNGAGIFASQLIGVDKPIELTLQISSFGGISDSLVLYGRVSFVQVAPEGNLMDVTFDKSLLTVELSRLLRRQPRSSVEDSRWILGYWKLIEMVQDGVVRKCNGHGPIVQFTPDHVRYFQEEVEYEYELLPEESPKAIDKYSSSQPDVTIKGIYELNQSELRVSFHKHDVGTRPTAMVGIRNDKDFCVEVYRRLRWKAPQSKAR